MVEAVSVKYKDHEVGALSFNTETGLGAFEYNASFIRTGIELSPLKMPLSKNIYSFPGLDKPTFKGLPGLIADSLPDDFGNSVLNAWVASQGRTPESISPLERLQYTGKRGMGALTYSPATQVKKFNASNKIEIQSLVSVAQEILTERGNFSTQLKHPDQQDKEAMLALMSVGMSAGGARPKAVLAFNENFTQVRSGQTQVPAGFKHYLMKFDGVSEHNKNNETFGDPMGFGAMEYVYYLMARRCGITMTECHLLNEGARRHFITQRFDRISNQKVHTQTLNGLAHVSYKQPGSFSYEELIGIARQLRLSQVEAMQIFKRMVFNVVARNHDDHAKNFAFILNEQEKWALSPAYDIAYSFKPGNKWVNSHWMSLAGKRENFNREDFYQFERLSPIFTKTRINEVIDETIEIVSTWKALAVENEVPNSLIEEVNQNLRLHI
ncbi:type II toxin-antitoxin system HipA family toxin [Psychromonas sp. SR45-3]|uniref:type II toxin-antitoxin system HipA family toxin n=1 Tax=Psychromonas sp. SR45-3 TaxID=2760930 RepID=UPI0015F8361A|nr:type II toxin-antitoxin system HipA family toxin [Psychromonas sp. SR45-3]MBB1274721.1 type II toxin-antitoxin system HipA family toxin [Psychromonas sp. SR45-3]